jgi:hypothetical protein
MFQNTCTKCGQPFDTKNPNRVVCPNCLYPGREAGGGYSATPQFSQPRPQYGERPAYGAPRPQYGDRPAYPPREYPPREGGGYPPREYPPREGGYAPRPQYGERPAYGAPRPGGFGGPRPFGPRPGGGFRPGGGRPGGRPGGPPRGGPKKLLIPKEVLIELEKMYVPLLPLPNPDVHEVLAEKLSIEPSKAFFGINLIRMKMKLPKLEYPKRKLAVTPDQLMAIEAMYTPYMTMPTPPIGIHKILAKQLKIDEWRVHVAIGLIRKAKNMPRWNTERDDLPEQMKVHLAALENAEADKPAAEPAEAKPKAKKSKTVVAEPEAVAAETQPPAVTTPEPGAPSRDDEAPAAPKKRGRPKKVVAEDS